MGTLIKMKLEVNNPELPVLTEQGILPYYTGVYVNKLAEKGIALTQTEINAVTAFINSLIEADLIDKIGTFYPFMGDVNVPLLGNRELEIENPSTNPYIDFVDAKPRGLKGIPKMPNINFRELSTSFDKGLFVGGSLISKTLSSQASSGGIFLVKPSASITPSIQFRFQRSNDGWKFAFYDFYDSSNNNNIRFTPSIEESNSQNNYSFYYGWVNNNHAEDTILYNRTLFKNEVQIANSTGKDASHLMETTNFGDYYLGNLNYTDNDQDRVLTTLVIFNEILTNTLSKAFCQALDTFTSAVGKTVSVG